MDGFNGPVEPVVFVWVNIAWDTAIFHFSLIQLSVLVITQN